MNLALLPLAAINPGLLPLALMDSPSSAGRTSKRVRYLKDRRAREDEERRQRRAEMFERQPFDVRGLDPEEDEGRIEEIEANRTLADRVRIDAEFERKLKRNRNYDIDGLCPEEDEWLIDRIIAERPLRAAERAQRRLDLSMQTWVQGQIDNMEGRP